MKYLIINLACVHPFAIIIIRMKLKSGLNEKHIDVLFSFGRLSTDL